MNKKVIVAAGALALVLTGCDQLCQGPKTKTALVTEKDKYSYALGAHFGNQAHFQLVTRDSIDLDLDLFVQAFVERYKQDSAKWLMADSTIFQTLTELSQSRQAEKMKKDSIAAASNKAAGEAFLAQNKTAEGVVTTESGLQYKVITEGTGATPVDGDIVKVHYTGTLLDGTKFDSSVDRGEPLEFPIGAVIPGWTEMLKLMKVGEKVTAWIPSDLAYGPRGRGPQIPGNSTLVFEMELIATRAADAPAEAAAPAEPPRLNLPRPRPSLPQRLKSPPPSPLPRPRLSPPSLLLQNPPRLNLPRPRPSLPPRPKPSPLPRPKPSPLPQLPLLLPRPKLSPLPQLPLLLPLRLLSLPHLLPSPQPLQLSLPPPLLPQQTRI